MNELFRTMVKPFEESECKNRVAVYINTNHLIKQNERKLELLEAIQSFEFRKRLLIDSINGFPGTFNQLRRKYVNNIDTLNKCINRMYQKYLSV